MQLGAEIKGNNYGNNYDAKQGVEVSCGDTAAQFLGRSSKVQ